MLWFLPLSITVTTILLAIPPSRYMALILEGHYRPPRLLRWFEQRLDTGPQNCKQSTAASLIFNTVLFVYNFSQEHPGQFPAAVTRTASDGTTQTSIEPVKGGYSSDLF